MVYDSLDKPTVQKGKKGGMASAKMYTFLKKNIPQGFFAQINTQINV